MMNQTIKQQTENLALVALLHNGTSKNAKITKHVSQQVKYQYIKYWFDFSAHIKLEDKEERDKLSAFADVQLRIDDNLLVITVQSRCGRMKVLTQLNVTSIEFTNNRFVLDSPTCYMEVL